MKQFKMVMPLGKADQFATYSFEKEIRVLLSWATDDFFSGSLYVICAAKEETMTEVLSGPFKQHLKQ
jgi:hypothetical protein